MKRDLDLIRNLLLAVEAQPPGNGLASDDYLAPGAAHEDIYRTGDHVKQLVDYGYVSADMTETFDGVAGWYIRRITGPGHDYLDSVRDPEVYRLTKERLRKVGGSAALEVVKAVSAGVTRSMLGLPC